MTPEVVLPGDTGVFSRGRANAAEGAKSATAVATTKDRIKLVSIFAPSLGLGADAGKRSHGASMTLAGPQVVPAVIVWRRSGEGGSRAQHVVAGEKRPRLRAKPRNHSCMRRRICSLRPSRISRSFFRAT